MSEERVKNVYQMAKLAKPRIKTDPGVGNGLSNSVPTTALFSSSSGLNDKPTDNRDNIKHRLLVFQRRRSLASGHMPN
jgi:hypothetical protein